MSEQSIEALGSLPKTGATHEIAVQGFTISFPANPLIINGIPHTIAADEMKIKDAFDKFMQHGHEPMYGLTGAVIEFTDPSDQLKPGTPNQVYDREKGQLMLSLPGSLVSDNPSRTYAIADHAGYSLDEQFWRGLLTYDESHHLLNTQKLTLLGGIAAGALTGEGVSQFVVTAHSGNLAQYAADTVFAAAGCIAGAAIVGAGFVSIGKERLESNRQKRIDNAAVKINKRLATQKLAYKDKGLFYILPKE